MGLTDRWIAGASRSAARTFVAAATPDGDEHLLLAPLDEDARTVLARVLAEAGVAFEQRGRILTIAGAGSRLAALNACLSSRTSAALRARVKAAFVANPDSPECLVDACLDAQCLADFLELSEVGWIRAALRDGWLYSVFQPVLETDSGSVFGYEALVRARNPVTGDVITAGELIYAAGRLNLQHLFDQTARVTAIREAALLGQNDACFFVNFSPSAIYEPDVCLRSTVEAAEQCGVPLSRIVFDMVDVSEIDDGEGLGAILDYYRRRGARVALDDVTGSLGTMQLIGDLRPDYIKIDCGVVATASAFRSRMRLDPIMKLARGLGLQVIAEGVETPEQMALCREAGVDYVQGYLFGRPANPPLPVSLEPFLVSEAA